jgi:hypothetical protein
MELINIANLDILNQFKSVLVQFDAREYKKALRILNDVSLGQHTRHIIEFYICLFNSLESGNVNYDSRERDLRIESDLEYATSQLDIIIAKFNTNFIDQNISLEFSLGLDNYSSVNTTFNRELTYLMEHTIHHLAIINIAVKAEFQNIILPSNFGVAYSTIQYNKSKTFVA